MMRRCGLRMHTVFCGLTLRLSGVLHKNPGSVRDQPVPVYKKADLHKCHILQGAFGFMQLTRMAMAMRKRVVDKGKAEVPHMVQCGCSRVRLRP